MVQEIITYIIIAVSVSIALLKMYKTVAGSRRTKKTTNYSKVTYTPGHNCSDCIAECSLRDAVPALRKENEELCESTVVKITNS